MRQNTTNRIFQMVIFWVVTACGFVGGGTSVSEEHTASMFRVEVCPHDVTTQKTTIDILTAVRTSDLMKFFRIRCG
jgi:hypothetical protein